MSEEARGRVRRRLAAILVVGLSRLFPGEEKDNFTGLRAFLTDVIDPLIPGFEGNIFKQTGDLVLIEFDSVVEATRCAAALRDAVIRHNQTLANEQRLAMRIGINLGDIIAEGGDIFGDGVNIAARIEALAEPGSIYMSEMAYHHVADKLDFDFEDLGPQNLKNIRRPIRVYRMGAAIKDQAADLDDADPAVAASPSGFDDRRAIAVLPFANFSGDPEQEFFADGITEDIITMLAGWRAFPVIARNSTFNYRGQTVDIKKVGEELGVRYVLEGSVRKSGRRVRVTAQLIRADTNHHIMAERYDRDLTDLFELQDEIVTTIAGAIEPELLKFERERIVERAETNEDAYQFYQRGMWHHYRQNKADNIEAQAYFRRALAIDAQYPQATAALSIALSSAAMIGWADDADARFEDAYELARQAVTIDPRYPNAHFALGLACMWTHRPDRGTAAFEEAIKLNPSFAAAHVLLGQMYLYADRPEEAVEQAGKGIRLSPSDPRLFIWLPALAGAHYQMRRYGEAVEAGRRSWSLNRNWPHGLRYVVAGLAQLNRIADAQAALTDLKLMDANLESSAGVLRRVYPNPAAVDHILEGLRKAGFE
ncbi:MAG TPA: adenylate/guanylate cyclase domain-containing protein [Stellaceae bacterium]|nr:adenylate/guanylate cyclase domain-containing protein [Stellaceae bacterium]